jgi:PAS domain S-box-containing protein
MSNDPRNDPRVTQDDDAFSHRSLTWTATNNQTLSTLIAAAPLPIVVIATDGIVKLWNPAAERLFGYTEAQVLGQPISILPPDQLEECSRVVQAKTFSKVETRNCCRDNLSLKVSISVAPLYDEQAEVQDILLMFQDVTQQQQAEAELLQKNAILKVINEASPTPIFVKDRQGKIIYANPATLEVLGLSEEEVIGSRDCDLYPNLEDALRVMENDQRIMESGQTEVVEETPDGIRTFLGMKAPYRNETGEVIGLIGISNDITDRVQVERDRERVLQQEQAAREAAEQANRIKDEFLAVLSHELRTPMNPILGWIKLLKQGNLSPEKREVAIETIERNAKLQVQLIEDLLDISGILQGKFVLKAMPVDLQRVIQAAIETVQLASEAKGLSLQMDFAPSVIWVLGDAGRLQQVVWNLLSNAIKFTPGQGAICVNLTTVGPMAQIQIRDSGIGINPEFLPYVFERFCQEDGAITRRFGGLGLGLAIARQIVEMHGGRISVDSLGENQGATFTVQLPLLQVESSETVDPPVEISDRLRMPLANVNALVVDDDQDNGELIAFLLQEHGATVSVTTSASEALQALSQSHFDVLLSDIGMPEMDGYMLIRAIRAQADPIPAIALTAYAGELNQQQAIAAGFQHHSAKPVNPEEVIRLIRQLLPQQCGVVSDRV